MDTVNFTARIDLRAVTVDQAQDLRSRITAAVAGVVGDDATIDGDALVMRSRPPARQAQQGATQ